MPAPESLRAALDQAWRDHHHARDQTWRTVQIEAVLAAGLVSVDFQYESVTATGFAAALVVLASILGVLISLHHRELECRKFLHITNLERALELIRDDLIPSSSISAPPKLKWWHIFDLRVLNTAAFILRMHAAILAFALVVFGARWLGA